MSRDGSGNYSLPAGNPVSTGTTISSTWANNTLSDIATALTQSISKDGQTTYTANQPMGGNKHTSIANASARDQYAAFGQVQDGAAQYLTSVSGTNTITASLNSLAAYAAGQRFAFIAANTNTGAVTININGLGAKDITKQGTTALVSGDIPSGVVVNIVYDGTRFQMQGFPATMAVTSLTVTGTATFASGTWSGTGAAWTGSSSGNPTIDYTNSTSDGASAKIRFFKSRSGGTTNSGDIAGLVQYFAKDLSSVDRGIGYFQFQQTGAAGASFVPGQFILNVTSSAGADTNIVSAVATNFNVINATLTEAGTRVFCRNSVGTAAAQNYTAANTLYTFAHGLGAKPVLFMAYAECVTTEFSYAVGDVIDLGGASGTGSVTVSADATNIYVAVAGQINVSSKAGAPAFVNLTPSAAPVYWSIFVRAWY